VREAQALFGKLLTQDSYLRFGLILFLAGAAETFARRAGVAQKQLVELLSIEIENLGASKQHAKGFAANIDEYLLDQRYFDMYAAGRAGALRISKGTNDDSGLERAVETWRLPPDADQSAQSHDDGAMPDSKHFDSTPRKGGGEEEPLGFVAVLFTDIVDSTNLQQKNGDKWMMNVVRAHNDIVREAIQRFGGREIKHTGDGIMASFPDVLGAAEASLAMQDGFGRFSEMMPDLAFQVRAGLSAGEPIHESGDIFGTPVNLAARVMSKAGAGEIAVSSIVREMCQGQAMKFQELGRFELKGFPEPQPIYRLTRPRKRLRDNKTARSTATVPAG
jgi:adenylate cyclase